MFITKFHPKVCSHIPDRSLIPDILLWNTNSSEMNIPAKLAKNIAKTASRNIFIILFMHSETISFDYLRERAIYCFTVYFSVSAYFVITGLACGKFLFCHTSSFCGFYTCVFTIFGSTGVYLISISGFYPAPFQNCSFGCGSHRQRRSREDCFTLYCY